MSNTETKTPHPMPAFQKAVLALVVAVLVVSVVARMLLVEPNSPAPNPIPVGARSFATETAATHAENVDWWQSILPVATEASLFGLLGFAVGYSTRKVFKLALLAIALGFVAIQILVARGTIEFDWGGAAHAVEAWLLNLQPDVPFVEFLRTHIPTAIAFVACWIVGFRRG